MSLFLSGLALTAVAPLLCRKALPHGGPQWIYTMGCTTGVLGPYFLLCTIIDMRTILLVCVGFGALLCVFERIRRSRRLDPISHGVVAFAIQLVPVAALILVIRSFVVEPYVVPSSSMRPNLAVGNFVLVDKITYGLRLPISNTLFWKVSAPHRTDILVFRFPLDRSKPYIKRVIGLPGDEVEYRSGTLSVNNVLVSNEEAGRYEYIDENTGKLQLTAAMTEKVDGSLFKILPDVKAMELGRGSDFPGIPGCERNSDGLKCRVPIDSYFVLGDNRGDSLDSRYWGFVHQSDIIGRALYSVSIDRHGIKLEKITK